MILERFGYEVIFKTSGKEALEVFTKTPERFDVVITDLTMPEMNGDVLASRIKKVRPGIPVILCTGLLEDDYASTLNQCGVDAFIKKPYDKQVLVETIRKVDWQDQARLDSFTANLLERKNVMTADHGTPLLIRSSIMSCFYGLY